MRPFGRIDGRKAPAWCDPAYQFPTATSACALFFLENFASACDPTQVPGCISPPDCADRIHCAKSVRMPDQSGSGHAGRDEHRVKIRFAKVTINGPAP